MVRIDYKNKNKPSYDFVGKIKLKVLLLVAAVTFLIISAQLVFANNLATDGQKIAKIKEEIHRYETENTTLKVEIAQESSLTTLYQKAQKLDFNKPARIITP